MLELIEVSRAPELRVEGMDAVSNVEESKRAVAAWAREDPARLRDWLAEFDAGLWDLEIEEDAVAGRLDDLATGALRDLERRDTTEL